MAEQRLDGADIDAVLEQVGREPVAERNGMQSVMETQFRIWLETKRFDFILLTITVCS